MLFNTATFLVFALITFSGYWILNRYSLRWSNFLLFVASYVFYGWWDWRFLILIFISSISDFVFGKLIFEAKGKKQKKVFLLFCIFISLGLLGFFKYFNFFIESFSGLITAIGFHPSLATLRIILPVGISFYTFQSMSYTIDIYRGKLRPVKSPLIFFTFVAFFPQLVAGPIERASHLIPQFEKPAIFSYSGAKSGMRFILWGLFKKMVIADRLSVFVDQVYNSPGSFSGVEIIMGTLFFGLQIYCDFSGYSDIAVGVAKLFGKELMMNFRTPYLATSFKDFWQRWHISLSTWFRDYVYIPLGGNRCSSKRQAANIMVTFSLSGLWHGANLSFVVWGIAHGLLLVAERFFPLLFRINKKVKIFLGWILTFSFVNLCWVFFRSSSIVQVRLIFSKIFSSEMGFRNLLESISSGNNFTEFGFVLSLALPLFIISEVAMGRQTFDEQISKIPRALRWSGYYILALMILFLGVLNSAPQFIYFQF